MTAQDVAVGPGSIATLDHLFTRHQARRILLVTGRASFETSGARQALAPVLSAREVVRFAEFQANPTVGDVERGMALWRSAKPDLVLAIGGGSVLDVAKAVNLLAAQTAPAMVVVARPATIESRGCPLIAVPTTAGSGSEATHFATLYLDGVKHSLVHEWLRPDHAVVDSGLTASMPPRLTAVTGLDALSQAIESYWAVGATRDSQALAAAAIERIRPALAAAVKAPDAAAREHMACGAHLAGRAIDISRTTAAHAVSYALTAHHGVAHGHAVALTLGAFLEHAGRTPGRIVNDPRGPAYVDRTLAELCGLLGCRTPAAAAAAWQALLARLDIPPDLAAVGVAPDAVDSLVHAVNAERLSNHPVRLSPDGLRGILAGLMRRP